MFLIFGRLCKYKKSLLTFVLFKNQIVVFQTLQSARNIFGYAELEGLE